MMSVGCLLELLVELALEFGIDLHLLHSPPLVDIHPINVFVILDIVTENDHNQEHKVFNDKDNCYDIPTFA
jgi:hypothetical protein